MWICKKIVPPPLHVVILLKNTNRQRNRNTDVVSLVFTVCLPFCRCGVIVLLIFPEKKCTYTLGVRVFIFCTKILSKKKKKKKKITNKQCTQFLSLALAGKQFRTRALFLSSAQFFQLPPLMSIFDRVEVLIIKLFYFYSDWKKTLKKKRN